MKHLKKIASLLLALVMVLSLATTAFAADGDTDNGKITISDAIVGQTYTIYQILDLESYNETAKAYSYKVAAGWENFFKAAEGGNAAGAGLSYVDIDDQGYVTWKSGADVKEFAKAAKTYAATLTGNQGQTTATTTTVTFENLDLGYYLIDTTLGTICSLDTTNNEVIMAEKNEAPTSDKKVQEDSTSNWGATNDADIGQTVNYKSEIAVKAGAVNYTLRDTMTSGLTLDASSIQVKVGETVIPATTTEGDVTKTNYTVKTGDAAKPYTFTIAFDNDWIATQVGKTIVITYSATLNENAVIAGDGNKNTADLEYGNKPEKDRTPGSTTVTKTWQFDVEKFTYVTTKNEAGEDIQTENKLAGATFTLSKKNDGADPIKFVKVSDNVYRVAKENETGAITEITTDATGKFTLQGLDSDTYYLTETKAPDGYNKLAGPVTVTISDDGKVNKTAENTEGVTAVKVENNAGSELPSTGGMGTTLFYTIGGILMLAAVVLLVTKKRMSIAE